MLLGLNTQTISSYQTIEFKLSQNYICSRNGSLTQYNEYEPGSLTYTETEVGQLNSMKFIDIQEVQEIPEDKENFHDVDVQLDDKRAKIWMEVRNPQSQKVIQHKVKTTMKRKKSILVVNNLQLNLGQQESFIAIKVTGDETKRSTASSIHTRPNTTKPSSFLSRSRKSSISSQSTATNNLLQSPNFTEQSIVSSNGSSPSSCKIDTLPSQCHNTKSMRKRSFSEMKSQGRTIGLQSNSMLIKCVSKQGLKLKRAVSVREAGHQENKAFWTKMKSISQNVETNLLQHTYKEGTVEHRLRQLRRRNFLEDPLPLETIINVKQLKLQENSEISRNYLRKIIQNRVSIHHYAQNLKSRIKARQ